jgi:hypothetical protein
VGGAAASRPLSLQLAKRGEWGGDPGRLRTTQERPAQQARKCTDLGGHLCAALAVLAVLACPGGLLSLGAAAVACCAVSLGALSAALCDAVLTAPLHISPSSAQRDQAARTGAKNAATALVRLDCSACTDGHRTKD